MAEARETGPGGETLVQDKMNKTETVERARMPLAVAERYAKQILRWLGPFSERLVVAGSIRRKRPVCADVDIVCIPRRREETDLVGHVVQVTNFVWDFLRDYVRDKNASGSLYRTPRFISGGEREGKQVLMELPKCQLDLWFADERTFGTRLLCRTGSKEHNMWLAQRAEGRGLHWNPYEGLFRPTIERGERVMRLVPARTEAEIYGALGLEFIEAENREEGWIRKNLEL